MNNEKLLLMYESLLSAEIDSVRYELYQFLKKRGLK